MRVLVAVLSFTATKRTLVNDGSGDYKIFDYANKLVKEIKADVKADPTNPVSSTGNLDFYHFNNFIKAVRGRKNKFPGERRP